MKKAIGMFLMSEKGYQSLKSVLEQGYSDLLGNVVIGRDKNVAEDYSSQIKSICEEYGVQHEFKSKTSAINTEIVIAISWRWLIPLDARQKLIVLHDSLLPKYRGFAPLVNAILNRETELGVTALFASEEYDRGDVISQASVTLAYPIKIEEAIRKISSCYSELVLQLFDKFNRGEQISGQPQIEEDATYSLWRDEEDYKINWQDKASAIQNFVNAVGHPYKGALSYIGDDAIRILDVDLEPDVNIENRDPGKVIFIKNEKPIVVCGEGLLRINKAIYEVSGTSALPLPKFRSRFKS